MSPISSLGSSLFVKIIFVLLFFYLPSLKKKNTYSAPGFPKCPLFWLEFRPCFRGKTRTNGFQVNLLPPEVGCRHRRHDPPGPPGVTLARPCWAKGTGANWAIPRHGDDGRKIHTGKIMKKSPFFWCFQKLGIPQNGWFINGKPYFQSDMLLVGGWTTHLKNLSEIGLFPQVGMKIKNM